MYDGAKVRVTITTLEGEVLDSIVVHDFDGEFEGENETVNVLSWSITDLLSLHFEFEEEAS
jgi:hypothetical protein